MNILNHVSINELKQSAVKTVLFYKFVLTLLMNLFDGVRKSYSFLKKETGSAADSGEDKVQRRHGNIQRSSESKEQIIVIYKKV